MKTKDNTTQSEKINIEQLTWQNPFTQFIADTITDKYETHLDRKYTKTT